MPTKTEIVDFLGDRALVLPPLLERALIANDQAKYVLSLLQMAASHADHPDEETPSSLRAERETCAIEDADLDRSIVDSDGDGQGNYHIPRAGRLVALLDEATGAMLAPLALLAQDGPEAAAAHARYRERFDRLVEARPQVVDDIISGDTIAALSSGRPRSGDGFHVLIMDLHKEIDRLQGMISTEEVDGAKAYGIYDSDRPLIAAFMQGVKRTAPLKFDHPGLATAAARSGATLLLMNDIGVTDAHVLVIRVTEAVATITHTDVHVQRLRFFQSLLADQGIEWQELRPQQTSDLAKGDLFYVAHGRFEAKDPAALAGMLEHLGSRLVFLIDWNKARKRLRLLVPPEAAASILRWAADRDFGHRGFLSLGGEQLVYEALQQAVKTPLRYGQPLHDMIGTEVAQDYLCYVLQTTATGLLKGQSPALIRDQIRAELFNHFHSAEQRLLEEVGRHAAIVIQLARGLRGALRQEVGADKEALTRNAAQAKLAESRADDIVKDARLTARRISGTEIFFRILEVADDAADELEDSAFLAGLLSGLATLGNPPPLLALADLLVDGAQTYQRAISAAPHVHRGGARETMQQFLEAIDHLVTVEHQTDERERAVIVALLGAEIDGRQLHLASGIAHHLESAADALLRAGLMLRDHVLGEVMFA